MSGCRDDTDGYVKIQVLNQLLDDAGLLGIFLAKVGNRRADEVEEFGDDRRHARKVTRARRALPARRQTSHVDAGLKVLGVESAGRWSEQEVNVCGSRQPDISVPGPRVVFVIAALVELSRIHEDADDDAIGVPAGATNQSQVACVQGAHRGDKADRLAVLAYPRREPL